jgi:hypothetical protein
VGTTGLIFGAIVAAWLAYLVPMYLKKHQATISETDPATRFSGSVQIVQFGAERIDAEGNSVERANVSTPLTRRSAVAEICGAERQAAGRRRNVILVLGSLLILLGLLALVGVAPWGLLAIPGGLLAAFLTIARFSVQAMHRSFEERLDRIDRGCDEDTVIVADEVTLSGEKGRKRPNCGKSRVEEVELGAPVGEPGALWDPLPITRPTYVSTPPVRGRTVRTIDLTEPIMVAPGYTPVVADAPEASNVVALRPAVGE